jgi:hypothetical protein
MFYMMMNTRCGVLKYLSFKSFMSDPWFWYLTIQVYILCSSELFGSQQSNVKQNAVSVIQLHLLLPHTREDSVKGSWIVKCVVELVGKWLFIVIGRREIDVRNTSVDDVPEFGPA